MVVRDVLQHMQPQHGSLVMSAFPSLLVIVVEGDRQNVDEQRLYIHYGGLLSTTRGRMMPLRMSSLLQAPGDTPLRLELPLNCQRLLGLTFPRGQLRMI